MVEKVLGNEKEIIFVPDKYLAAYVEEKTGRKFIKWNGYCPTHVKILPEFIVRQKKLSPQAEVLVHPECVPAVIKLADGVFSTEGMVKYVKQSKAAEFIIGTEIGLIHRLQKEAPAKKFYPASELATCPNMKLITLEKVLSALEEEKTEVTVPPAVAEGARKSIQKMLDFSD
jgi:quinolinate synthase